MKTAKQLMTDNMLVKHYAGSIAYGTNIATSDVDFRGIFCGDPINILTPFFKIKECEDSLEEDTKLYELSHFLQLCLDCNPNIIETLWVDESDIVFTTPAYQLLRDNRERLLSRKVAFTTSGYALSQLKRIKGHNKWISNPQPEQPPRQIDFISMVQNFTQFKIFKLTGDDILRINDNHRLVPYGGHIYGVYKSQGYQLCDSRYLLNTNYEGDCHELGVPLYIVKFNYDEYNTAKEKHANYWTWKNNRNETRSELEEQFGYDTKHAMHLIRLLRMGEEALTTGQIIVKRPDAQELLAIRNGSWKYEELVEYAEMMDDKIRNQLYNSSPLCKKPDIHFAAQLLMQVQNVVWDK